MKYMYRQLFRGPDRDVFRAPEHGHTFIIHTARKRRGSGGVQTALMVETFFFVVNVQSFYRGMMFKSISFTDNSVGRQT